MSKIRRLLCAIIITLLSLAAIWWLLAPTNGFDAPADAFGNDIVTSPGDVPYEARIHSSIPSETAVMNMWYRDHLDSDEKKALYDTMDAALAGVRRGVTVPSMSLEDVCECFWAVIYDHPSYFWVENSYDFIYTIDGDNILEFHFHYYSDDVDYIQSKMRDYELMADTIISGTDSPANRSQIMEQLYIWIENNTSYASADDDQVISSVFDGKRSVCAGYTQALQFMALRAGIPCTRISGHSLDEEGNPDLSGNHTWVAAAIGKEIRYYDVTWDDVGGYRSKPRYFKLTQEELEETHAFENELAPRANETRNDSVELIETSWNIMTGEHLKVPDPVDVGEVLLPISTMLQLNMSVKSAVETVQSQMASAIPEQETAPIVMPFLE